MRDRIEVKTWKYHDTQTITMFLKNKKVSAKIYDLNGNLEYKVPSYDMNLPREILNNASWPLLSRYVEGTHVKLTRRDDGTIGLYINQQLKGGGWWDGILSGLAIVGGVALIGCTGGIGTLFGAGLINGGINGVCQAAKTKDNFTWNFWTQSLGGYVSGIFMGGAGLFSGLFTSNLLGNSWAFIAKLFVHATGGGMAQAANDVIVNGEINKANIVRGVGTGAIVGGLAALSSIQSEGNITFFASTLLNQGHERIIKPEIDKPWQEKVNLAEQKANTSNQNNKALNQKNQQKDNQLDQLIQSAQQDMKDICNLNEEKKTLQAQLDQRLRNNVPDDPQPLRRRNGR